MRTLIDNISNIVLNNLPPVLYLWWYTVFPGNSLANPGGMFWIVLNIGMDDTHYYD